MTFSKNALAEWHSWATYRQKDYYQKLYANFLIDKREEKPDRFDIDKHLLQIDLAIYDEIQWSKIMHEVEMQKVKNQAR